MHCSRELDQEWRGNAMRRRADAGDHRTSTVPSGSFTRTFTRPGGVSSARSCSKSKASPPPCDSSSATPRLGGRREKEAVITAALCRHNWCDRVGKVQMVLSFVSLDTWDTPARNVNREDGGFATQSALTTKGTCSVQEAGTKRAQYCCSRTAVCRLLTSQLACLLEEQMAGDRVNHFL